MHIDWQNKKTLFAAMYCELMADNIGEVMDKRIKALKEIERDETRVSRAYNKKVKGKSFQVRDLVWRTVLPLRTRINKYGKWSSSWYTVVKVVFGNSYLLETLQGNSSRSN